MSHHQYLFTPCVMGHYYSILQPIFKYFLIYSGFFDKILAQKSEEFSEENINLSLIEM